MKTQPIKNIIRNDELIALALDLFHNISIAYKLKEPDVEFAQYFINVIKEHYGFITFEQIQDAFDRNAIGSLNGFLPKAGYSIDNKVNFSIADMTKIIRAYLSYSTPKNKEKKEERRPQHEIDEIHRNWVIQLDEIFLLYKAEKMRTQITIPIYTAQYLANAGLIENKLIDRKESNIKIKFGKIKLKPSVNENLIYKCFDELINDGITLMQVIN